MNTLPNKKVLQSILRDTYKVEPPKGATKQQLHELIQDLDFETQNKAYKKALNIN